MHTVSAVMTARSFPSIGHEGYCNPSDWLSANLLSTDHLVRLGTSH